MNDEMRRAFWVEGMGLVWVVDGRPRTDYIGHLYDLITVESFDTGRRHTISRFRLEQPVDDLESA